MAIYHLHVQIISRGKGRSAIAAAAYRSAEKLHDEQLGRNHSYEKKQGVEHKEILAPANVPAWVHDREQLWNHVEAGENRKDARLAREVQVALPVELSHERQVELVRDFVNEQFVKRGMVADLAIHRDNPENPHCHIMLTTRDINEQGFGMKQTAWNAKEMLIDWREGWADSVNRHLQLAGHQLRVDHRSFEAQGIKLEPGIKLGVSVERRQIDGRDIIAERLVEHDRIVRANGEAIAKDPQLALDAITRQRATFTKSDAARWLNTRTIDADQFQECLAAVLTSPEVVRLGPDGKGQQRFTTREMLEIERNMVDDAQRMKGRQSHQVADRYLAQAEHARPNLSDEQRAMVRHVVKDSGDLAVVQGVAGAGKSYALATAREAWEAQGFQVKGAALAGKAAEGLEVSAGITSRSIHAWERSWQNGYDRLTSKDVLVIDEAGMVGSRQMQRVLAEAERAGAKVVLVGDVRQLQAIEAGAPMRAIAERVGQVSLDEVRRQEDDWQKKASEDLAKGNVAPALAAYEKAGNVHEHGSTSAAVAGMVERWNDNRQTHPQESHLMLAFRRDEVRALNDAARAMRQANGELGPDQRIATENGERNFAAGDRMVFLQNDRRLGVKNGTLGTVEKMRGNLMVVRLDGPAERRIAFDVRDYKHLDHGYAVTVHKAQGITADRVHVLASDLFDQHVAYVALSRHRKQVDLHWGRETFRDRDHLVQQLSRERMKDVALDHVDAERERQEQPEHQPQSEAAPTPQKDPGLDRGRRINELTAALAKAEDREHEAVAVWRATVRYKPEQAKQAIEGQGPAAKYREAAREAQRARLHIERELAELARAKLPDVRQRPPPESMNPREWLEASGRGVVRTHNAWAAFRDKAKDLDVLKARFGQGPGAALLAEFREARTRGQHAQKAAQLSLDQDLARDKGRGRGLGR